MGSSFKQFTPSKTKAFIKRLCAIDGICHLNEATTKILGQNLPFAQGWMRVDCENYEQIPHQKKIFLVNDTTIIPLAYSPNPKENLFEKLPIEINSENLVDYLILYFLSFVQNGERLQPVFHADDIDWKDDLTPMLRKSLDSDFSKYPIITLKDKNFKIIFPALFQKALMELTCEITIKGAVTITHRKILIEDLPV